MDKTELGLLADIKKMSLTPGGQGIIAMTKKIVTTKVSILANGYKGKTHEELIELCADLNANLDLYLLLTGADKKIKAIEEILEENEEDLDPFDKSNVILTGNKKE